LLRDPDRLTEPTNPGAGVRVAQAAVREAREGGYTPEQPPGQTGGC